MENKLKAGISIVDISPKQGIRLAGYPHYDRANTGIHDSLYASCMYLDNGKNKIAIVAMDILKYPKKYVRIVRERVSAYTDIPANNIMICCTHTHSGPLVSTSVKKDTDKATRLQVEYERQLEDKIVALILEAYNNTFPAKIGMEKGHCGKESGVGGNRRDPNGPADPEVWTIGLQDMEGRWRGVAVKYALHPTFIHGDSTVVTADYPCYIRRYLAESKPGITSLFLQGTSGNQSSRFFRDGQTYNEAKRVGEAIAKEADRVLDSMTLSNDVELIARSLETDIDIRKFPTLEQAQQNIKEAGLTR
jgi:neutral ceramidase